MTLDRAALHVIAELETSGWSRAEWCIGTLRAALGATASRTPASGNEEVAAPVVQQPREDQKTASPLDRIDVEGLKAATAEGWALVPLKPSRKLINDLAHEWAYTTEEAMESYHGFLEVVARHGFSGSDPAAYDEDAAKDALEDLQIEYGHARREALLLADWLHRTYYADVTDWKPFSEASGLLSQIDNMVAGVRDRLAAAEARTAELIAQRAALVATLERIRDLEPKPFEYPADWQQQIAACPECEQYRDHPVQHGICNTHRQPIWGRERHDDNEERRMGWTAKSMAREALSTIQATGGGE